jgi:hypothetical protein
MLFSKTLRHENGKKNGKSEKTKKSEMPQKAYLLYKFE